MIRGDFRYDLFEGARLDGVDLPFAFGGRAVPDNGRRDFHLGREHERMASCLAITGDRYPAQVRCRMALQRGERRFQ